MDGRFSFLSGKHTELLQAILAHRRSTLLERVRQDDVVSRSDAEEIMLVISDELNDNLDRDWEPTAYGCSVSSLLAKFNAARVGQWP
jgi:hypothetical protein